MCFIILRITILSMIFVNYGAGGYVFLGMYYNVATTHNVVRKTATLQNFH